MSVATAGVRLAADYRVFAGRRYASEPGSTPLELDLHVPSVGPRRHPTFVFFHGGGWVTGIRQTAALHLLPWMERRWATANVDYRLAREAPAPAAAWDARRAVRWLLRHAGEYGLDPEMLVLGGFSSGAHLALLTGMADRLPPAPDGPDDGLGAAVRPAAIVNWFGITDVAGLLQAPRPRAYARRWIAAAPDALGLARELSPLSWVGPATPPIITVHGVDDATVPFEQAARLHAALDGIGVRNRLVPVEGAGHGGFREEVWAEAYEAVFTFIDGCSGRRPAGAA